MKRAALLAIAGVIGIIVAVDLRMAPLVTDVVKRLPGRDTTGHFVLFAVLSLLINLAFARSRIGGRELGVPLCTGLLLVVLTLEEYSQKLIPGRDFNLTDLGASVAGAVLFAVAAWAILARTSFRRVEGARGSVNDTQLPS